MARIPVADIPNAPAPTMMPVGEAHQVNFSQAASLLHQDTIPQGAFDGAAEGAASLGKSLQSAGQSIGGGLVELGIHKQKADDDTAVINASAALQKAHADYQASLQPGSDTNTWAPGVVQALSDTAKPLLSNSALSADAKREIQNRFTTYSAQAYSSMQTAAAKESFQRSTQAHMDVAKQQIDSGDIEAAKKTYDVMAEKKLIYPDQADGLKYAATRTGEFNAASNAIASDPLDAASKLQDSSNWPTLSTSQRDSLTTDAKTQINSRKKQLLDFVTQGIETGNVADLKHAEDLGNGYFDDTDKMRIEQLLNKQTGPSYATSFGLQQRIANYDPAKDSDSSVAYQLYRDIKTSVPTGWQEPLLSAFEKAQNPKPEDSVLSTMVKRLDDVTDAGFLGRFDFKRIKAGDTAEMAKQEAAAKTALQIRKDAETWIKANPKASYPEANDWLNARLRDEILKQPVPPSSSFWNPFSWFRSAPQSPIPGAGAQPGQSTAPQKQKIDDALKKYRGQPGTTGKVTSYGYSGDPNTDSNSRNGVGAWDNKLTADSVAVSPDVEQQLTAAGVQPNDWVNLQLSDGSTVRKQWSDRTANDKTAAKLGLQPLRGRWDFYSPGGVHAQDGLRVLSFTKANS